MSDAARIRAGKVMAAIAVVSSLAGTALYVGAGLASEMYESWALHNAAGGVALGTVFYLLVQKQPRNGAVWAIGWSAGLQGVAQTLAVSIAAVLTAERFGREFVGSPDLIGDLPLPIHIGLWMQQWSWLPALGLLLTITVLLFPDGRLPTPRWRPVAWFAGVALSAATLGLLLETEILEGDGSLPALTELMLPLVGIAVLLSAAALATRFVRASGDERRQLRWFGFALALMGVTYVATFVFDSAVGSSLGATKASTLVLLPVVFGSMAVAILKYRLYEIDLVISRSLTYGALAVFIGAVYVGIVVGVGRLLGHGDRADFRLSIAATGVVAIAFQPVRRWVQRVANRLVYGDRATPYEVLARFSRGAAEGSDADLLRRIPRLIVDGTGAAQAALWVRTDRGFRVAASWPGSEHREIAGDQVFDDPDADYSLPAFHDGDLLGGLSLVKGRGETITPAEEDLVANLAAGMGLALRNARLTERLREQVEQLERSRDRVVTAADQARRSLEHDLDSGPQQQLVALKVKLGPTRAMAERAGAVRTAEVLGQLEADAGEALRAVREFAGGVYPPLLEAEGLVVALRQQARKAALTIMVTAEKVGRYPREVEAAVYFTVLEALQNTTKYADATAASVLLREEGGALAFEVRDDGRGFVVDAVQAGAGLSNMADRLDAVGGSYSLESKPGTGTTVSGRVPLVSAGAR